MPPERIYRALEGGGVRGIAHIGAAAVFDVLDDHYQTAANVGTSAGSDAAALLSAGVDPATAKAATLAFPFAKVLDGIDGVPVIGKFVEGGNLIRTGGMHDGAHLESAIASTLEKYAGVASFADIDRLVAAGKPHAAKLYIPAHDVRYGQVVFPDAYSQLYGVADPAKQSIAFAGRASSSIPGFFNPAPIRDAHGEMSYIADGGVDALLPYDLAVQLAKEKDPGARVINFALGEEKAAGAMDGDSPVFGLEYLFQLLKSISAGRRDELMRDPAVRRNTVMIDTSGVSSTEFNLTADQQLYLYDSGVVSGLEFAVRDLGTNLTATDKAKLTTVATTARRELMQLSGDAVRGKEGMSVAIIAPLQHRLDAVAQQLAPLERQIA